MIRVRREHSEGRKYSDTLIVMWIIICGKPRTPRSAAIPCHVMSGCRLRLFPGVTPPSFDTPPLHSGRIPARRRANLQEAFRLPRHAVPEETGESGTLPTRCPPRRPLSQFAFLVLGPLWEKLQTLQVSGVVGAVDSTFNGAPCSCSRAIPKCLRMRLLDLSCNGKRLL